MQSSLEFFCEECGAANPGDATHCFACKLPLTRSPESLPASAPIKPVTVAPPTTLQVTAGAAPAKLDSTASAGQADSLPAGTLLQKRYKIERQIGQGGYSIVYKAHDTARYNRVVSIKQINLRNLTSRQVIEATETFNRETTLLPGLRHEGIPRFYGHFTDPEHWYLVMEYVSGQTLEDYLQTSSEEGYCSLQETLRIGIALCSILEYLHLCKPSVIFRDVKPANIMLNRRKKVYLIDFGIARTFNPGKVKDTTPLGSPGYAAPEQYGRAQSDQRTDIYGLGATLQTLLTGCDPLDLRAGAPSHAPHPVPPEVQKLLASMMDSDPNRRPRNLMVVKQQLQATLARERRVFRYFMGVALGSVFFLWGFLTPFLGMHYYSLYPLFMVSACFWGLTGLLGFIFLLIFLTIPAQRPLALGLLTTILLILILISTHALGFPFLSLPFLP